MDELEHARPSLRARLGRGLQAARLWGVALFGAVGVVLALSLPLSARSESFVLETGDVSAQDVLAPYALAYNSDVLTEDARREAAEQVEFDLRPARQPCRPPAAGRAQDAPGLHRRRPERRVQHGGSEAGRPVGDQRRPDRRPRRRAAARALGRPLGGRQGGGDDGARAGDAQRDSGGPRRRSPPIAPGPGRRQSARRPGEPGGAAGLDLRRPQCLLQPGGHRRGTPAGPRPRLPRREILRRRRDGHRARRTRRTVPPGVAQRLRSAAPAGGLARGGRQRPAGDRPGSDHRPLRLSGPPAARRQLAPGPAPGGVLHHGGGGHAVDDPRTDRPAVPFPGRRRCR